MRRRCARRSRRPSSCRRRAIARRRWSRRSRCSRSPSCRGRRAPAALSALSRRAFEWPASPRCGRSVARVASLRAGLRGVRATIARTAVAAALGVGWGIRRRASSPGTSGPSFGCRRGDRAVALTVVLRARDRARAACSGAIRRSRRSSSSSRRCCSSSSSIPVGKSLLAVGARREGQLRAAARRRAPVHRRHLGRRLPRRRHALRRRDQLGAARDDRRRAVDAARPRARAGRAARRPALLRRAEA